MNEARQEHKLIARRKRNTIARPRLQSLGEQILGHQVTAIVAPAGYGKTVFVASLLEEPGWPPTAWYSLEKSDAQPYNFLYNLIQALKEIYPDFGRDSLRTLKSLENFTREWPIAVKALVQEMPREPRSVLIVDDLHLVFENEVVAAIIEYLLQHLPENLYMILLSRAPLPFKLYQKELEGELFRIGRQELLFTEDEARELFNLMNLDLNTEEITALCRRTEGWAVGLRLMGIYLKQSPGDLWAAPKGWSAQSGSGGSSFYQYLVNEVLDSLSDPLRDFILDASLLPFLEAGLCDFALNAGDSRANLDVLFSHGLLSPLEEENGVLRIHHLVADWLQVQAAERHGPEDIAAIRSRASHFFESQGDINRAIEQSALIGHWERAADLICRHGYDYFNNISHPEILYKWIEALPAELVEANCWLQYFKGTGMMHIDDQQAFAVLSSAVSLARPSGDIKCEACCILAMMITSGYETKLQKGLAAGALLAQSPDLLKNPSTRVEALGASAVHALITDNNREGLRLCRQALRLKSNPEQRVYLLLASAFHNFRLGNQIQAGESIEKALAIPVVRENDRQMIWVCTLGSSVLLPFGDFAAVRELVAKAMELAQKYNMLGHIARMHMFRALMLYQEGLLAEARLELELADQYFSEDGLQNFLHLTEVKGILFSISGGADARELLPRALELLAWFGENPAGQGLDDCIRGLIGTIAMEAGDFAVATDLFEECIQRYKMIGAKHDLAACCMLVAYLNLVQGHEKAADSLLRQSLAAVQSGRWISLGWLMHRKSLYALCRRALQKNIHPDWAARLLLRWFPEASRREIGFLLVSDNPEAALRARDCFQELGQQTGITRIHAFFLGGFRLFVNGLPVDDSDWITRKAESLFKYLLVRRRPVPKEDLMQILWPESGPDSGEGKLRMTLSYLRRSLAKTDLSPDFVVMRRGDICLDPDLEINCDYELFTEQAQKARQLQENRHPSAILALQEALHYYAGDFLPRDRFEDWAAPRRTDLHNLHLDVLGRLARLQQARGDLKAALQTGRQYLELEPADEDMVRLNMEMLSQMGKKQKARSLYKQLAAILEKDFDTVPESETTAMYNDIRP